MSLGTHSIGSGGKLPVGSDSDKAASGSEKVKSGDASKFSAAIDVKLRDQGGNASGSDERVQQSPANSRLQLPDHSKGAASADGNGNASLTGDNLEFIDGLLEHDEPSGVYERATDQLADAGFTGEIQGFNVPLASFGQRVTGTFSALVKVSSTAQDSQAELPASADTVVNDTSRAAESVGTPDDESQEAAGENAGENERAEEIDSEPPKPSGTFSLGEDVIAKFLGGSANDSSNYSTGGFVA